MRLTAFVACLLIGLSALSGCAGHRIVMPNLISPEEEGEPTLLSVTGPVAIDVESFNGDVIIQTNDELKDQVRVRVDREALHGWRRRTEATGSLANITSSAELAAGEFGPVVKVRTATTDAEPHYLRAHVLIEAPEIDGVTVRTSRGKVHAINISGPVRITTSEGDVRIMTMRPMHDPVVVINREGSIDYRVTGESGGRIDAQTIRGKVLHRVRAGHLSSVVPAGEDKLQATLNDGTNPIQLRTVDGDIRIASIDKPLEIGIFIYDP